MLLETHRGACVLIGATDLANVVARLTKVDEAFVVLTRTSDYYVQAAGAVSEGFVVEYRDGGPGDHYRGDRRVTADELTQLLTAYFRGEPAWSATIAWHRVRFEHLFGGPPPASA